MISGNDNCKYRQGALILALILALLGASGCSLFGPKKEKTAQELANEGMERFKDENYRQAIESFDTLKNWYPFSKYAILAELKIADAYYEVEEYEQAVFAYEEFENLHPRNEATAYVVYRIGLCNYVQIDSIDRDQTTAQRAMDAFRRLIKTFPQSRYAELAEHKIDVCLKSLAGNELYVGKFYYKAEHYKAARHRFLSIVQNYPDVGYHYEALHYLSMCDAAIKAKENEPGQESSWFFW